MCPLYSLGDAYYTSCGTEYSYPLQRCHTYMYIYILENKPPPPPPPQGYRYCYVRGKY
jgi:hypothetical protein